MKKKLFSKEQKITNLEEIKDNENEIISIIQKFKNKYKQEPLNEKIKSELNEIKN